MKKLCLNIALTALMLLTAGNTLAQTGKSSAWQQEWAAFERQSKSLDQRWQDSDTKLTRSGEVLRRLTDAVVRNADDVEEGTLEQDKANSEDQRENLSALRAEMNSLDPIIPQISAALDPALAHLQKLLALPDCKAPAQNADCLDIKLSITAFGFLKSRLQNAVKLRQQWAERLIEFVALNPEDTDDHDRFAELRLEIEDLAEQNDQFRWNSTPNEYSIYNPITENMVMVSYYQQGDYAEALEWALKSVASHEQEKDRQHNNTGIDYLNVAQAYAELGKSAEAVAWYQKALPVFNNQAVVYNLIAAVYAQQGNDAKALDWYQNALAINTDEQNSDTAASYNGIAKVYDHQGDYIKALEWSLKAVAVYEKELGETHPLTAVGYNTLASVYEHQENYEKALPEYLKAYRIRVKKSGRAYPDTRETRVRLKRTYLKTGNPTPFAEWLRENRE
ncbi:MAG: tetratricopeptide repeat protein [Zoogloeaceae bacterium]|jgi:tetratricopeptide (TPR) repeat protein|nr:tetratricopeptide repeat protein [Zoogloeaceae bacterium]